MNRAWYSLLLGAWMTALFWPFAHAGGYVHPMLLAFTPLFLSAADLWPHWSLRAAHWVLVLYGELSLAWNTWASLHWMRVVIGGAVHKLLALPVQDWNQMSAHLAAPLLLLGGFLGWLLFRQCRHYGQALALGALGAVVIPLNHVLWHLPAEAPLAAYLILGLAVLAILHQARLSRGAYRLSPPRRHYLIWGLVLLMPLVVGWQMPPHRAVDPLGIFKGPVWASLAPVGNSDVTGYGPGVTHIGHSLVPSQQPVFLAKTSSPYYWQAAVYSHFNGTTWSNSGVIFTYAASPADSGIPLITPSFGLAAVPNRQVVSTITDLASGPLTTLFYTGVPTSFSLPVTVHPRSQRFVASSAKHYRVVSLVPNFNGATLSQAPFSPAPASLSADMQMPRNLSPKVAQLAARITRGTTGPWAAANAIKRYLDHHYRYSYNVTPTQHNDVVNHFLFVDRQGYCDQFSTTFIMMMRSLKVPARWVVGYSPGQWDTSRHGYLVRAVDAHSWAEIWVNHIGWVPFDPTPGFQVPISSNPTSKGQAHVKPSGALTTPSTPAVHKSKTSPILARLHPNVAGGKAGNQSQHRRLSSKTSWIWPALALLILGLTSTALTVRSRRRQRALAERLWPQLQSLSHRRLGVRRHHQSPRQWGAEWVRFFPDDREKIWPMVRLLEAAFYRQAPLTAFEEAELLKLWRNLKRQSRRQSA